MRTFERTLVVLAVVAVVSMVAMVASARRRSPGAVDGMGAIATDLAVAPDDAPDHAPVDPGPVGSPTPDVTRDPSTSDAPASDAARIAWLLRTRSAGSYFGEMLAASDSMNHRWPDRRHTPMRVWVQELDPATPGWESTFPQLVRDAFSTWADAGVPIHFTFVTDSARGEIHVTWTDRFDEEMTGRTRWAHDRHRWIVGGGILLALHLPDGRPLGRDAVRAIALHEVGHLIGLAHTADAANVMSARVRVSELSEADQVTARLVYSLPPGSLKAPR